MGLTCPIEGCGKNVASNSRMVRHMMAAHIGEAVAVAPVATMSGAQIAAKINSERVENPSDRYERFLVRQTKLAELRLQIAEMNAAARAMENPMQAGLPQPSLSRSWRSPQKPVSELAREMRELEGLRRELAEGIVDRDGPDEAGDPLETVVSELLKDELKERRETVREPRPAAGGRRAGYIDPSEFGA